MERLYDYLFKIILIGDPGVGKTAFLYRFRHDEFSDNYIANIGVDFAVKTIQTEGKTVKLQCWDTAGQERFRTMSRAYFRGAHGVIIMYDITNRKSYEQLTHWLQEVDANAPPYCQKIVLGNKLDLKKNREVEEEEGREYIEGLPVDIPFFEISVKSGLNVEEAFSSFISNIKHEIDKMPPPTPPTPINISSPISADDKTCTTCC